MYNIKESIFKANNPLQEVVRIESLIAMHQDALDYERSLNDEEYRLEDLRTMQNRD